MSVHIDCDTCVVRGPACNDCVVTVLLGPPPELGFDDDERRALDVLAGSGLVPPLRMVVAAVGAGRRRRLRLSRLRPVGCRWATWSTPRRLTVLPSDALSPHNLR